MSLTLSLLATMKFSENEDTLHGSEHIDYVQSTKGSRLLQFTVDDDVSDDVSERSLLHFQYLLFRKL
jgi:hypothetical protein